MEPKEKKAFEPSGLVPRSIVRTFERFRQQLLPGSEVAAIREYRISRYQVLVSARCLFTLLTIPIATNWLVSSWILSPLIEHFWNTQQNEIFLNSHQEERAFAELEFFSEKLFFESLLNTADINALENNTFLSPTKITVLSVPKSDNIFDVTDKSLHPTPLYKSLTNQRFVTICSNDLISPNGLQIYDKSMISGLGSPSKGQKLVKPNKTKIYSPFFSPNKIQSINFLPDLQSDTDNLFKTASLNNWGIKETELRMTSLFQRGSIFDVTTTLSPYKNCQNVEFSLPHEDEKVISYLPFTKMTFIGSQTDSYTNKALSSTANYYLDNPSKIKEKVQNKILELAVYYNQQTILSITHIVGDLVSLFTLGCLFIWMKPEITILKSFLIEAIYSLSDTTKSFLLILLTDLLVGFHSPRGWETALELLLKHFGLPENQDFVFLFVATFPVLLDTVFKYWIFRHLNKISPSTVATYHSMIE